MTTPFPPAGRVIGVDHGSARVGLAVCDAGRVIASPLDTYHRRNPALDVAYFKKLAEQERAAGFVVGLPIHLSGREGEQAAACRRFGAWLTQVTGLPVAFWDERWTSSAADDAMLAAGLTRKRRQEKRDRVAAQLILEAFLAGGGIAEAISPGPDANDQELNRTPMTERDWATHVVETLQRAGYSALFAGGCVRDELLGLVPADYDVATSARPGQVTALFRRAHTFGASFGVVEVLGPRGDGGDWLKVQVATFRSDGTYTDGRRPDAVTFSTAELDAQRRDFTINGLFLDPVTGAVTDYVGGRADLAARMLRAIGDPFERFAEDKLRVVRAARMAARFGLTIDPATAAAARGMAPEVKVVSAERIAEELRKILAHPARVAGVSLLHDLDLMPVLLPEVADTTLSRQGVMARLPMRSRFEPAFATLFPPGVPTGPAARRLKLANDERDRLKFLTDHRMTVVDALRYPRSVLFPLLCRPEVIDLLNIASAEAIGTGADSAGVKRCLELVRDTPPDELNPPPLLTGTDLEAAGHKPGPAFKPALAAVRAGQLDGLISTRAEALTLAETLLPSGRR